MTRHFSILTAVCEMLMDFLAHKTELDPSLSITLLDFFSPNFNLEKSWRDFYKGIGMIIHKKFAYWWPHGPCGSLTPPSLGTGPRDKASHVLQRRVCTKETGSSFSRLAWPALPGVFLTRSQVCWGPSAEDTAFLSWQHSASISAPKSP